jgi:hypothetical protein
MSNSKDKTNEQDGVLSSLIPMIFMVIVSAATYMILEHITDSDDTSSKVLVYSVSDWLPLDSDRSISTEEIRQLVEKGDLAAKRAAEAGYIILPSKTTKYPPGANRLLPGMFPPSDAEGS